VRFGARTPSFPFREIRGDHDEEITMRKNLFAAILSVPLAGTA
jgi:hypothetical protein